MQARARAWAWARARVQARAWVDGWPGGRGGEHRVTLALDVLRDLQKVVEPGTFTLMVGGASDKIQQTASLAVVAATSDLNESESAE